MFFSLSRGIRKGCALSPLISPTVLEAMALVIRDDIRIKGGKVHKLFVYADDILAAIADPINSLPVLLERIDSYSKLSGYKINWHKSEAKSLSNTCHSSYDTPFNFKWIL